MLLYMPRFFVLDWSTNCSNFQRDCAAAAQAGARLVVFPEQFLSGYHGSHDSAQAEHLFLTTSSANPGLVICCGTVTADGQNWQYWYCNGVCVAAYAKVHLFKPAGEHHFWRAGSEYCSLDVDDLRVALGTCNDVRFPEQMHQLSRQGKLNLLVYPALWPWERDHLWSALLRARAIEHAAFAIGCCVAGVDNGLECFDGAGNYVFDPLGNPVYPSGRLYQLDESMLGKPLVDTQSEYVAIQTEI
jgi:predicted amidohydrolase